MVMGSEAREKLGGENAFVYKLLLEGKQKEIRDKKFDHMLVLEEENKYQSLQNLIEVRKEKRK